MLLGRSLSVAVVGLGLLLATPAAVAGEGGLLLELAGPAGLAVEGRSATVAARPLGRAAAGVPDLPADRLFELSWPGVHRLDLEGGYIWEVRVEADGFWAPRLVATVGDRTPARERRELVPTGLLRGRIEVDTEEPAAVTLTVRRAPARLSVHLAEGRETVIRDAIVLRPFVTMELWMTPPLDPYGRRWGWELLRKTSHAGRLEPVGRGRADDLGTARLERLAPGRHLLTVEDEDGSRWHSVDPRGGRLELAGVGLEPVPGEPPPAVLLIGETPVHLTQLRGRWRATSEVDVGVLLDMEPGPYALCPPAVAGAAAGTAASHPSCVRGFLPPLGHLRLDWIPPEDSLENTP